MKDLVIDRKKWLRGEVQSFLLREADGKMCCLGFLALDCGYTREDIKNEIWPAALYNGTKYLQNKWPKELVDCFEPFGFSSNSYLAFDIMQINDNSLLVQEEIENRLISLFAKFGYNLSFKN